MKEDLKRAILEVSFNVGKVDSKVQAIEEDCQLVVDSKIRGAESRIAERLEAALQQFKTITPQKPSNHKDKPKVTQEFTSAQPADDLRSTIKMILQDREQDIAQTTEIVETHAAQINRELQKVQIELTK